jgi:hypothetical protein
MIGEIMRSLKGKYQNFNYDIIIGISGKPSILTYFYPDGSPEEVKNYKAIGDWTYGSIFMQQNWHENMDMEAVAGIGYFIIRYIEKFQLNLGIGTGGHKLHPDVRFLPDYDFDYDASTQQIEKFEENAQRNLDRLSNQFKLDFC